MESKARSVLVLILALLARVASAAPPAVNPDWSAPQAPFKIYGNTYYVGSKGLTSLLITSDFGHVLIDGGLPQNAKLIAANIQALGFKLTDVKAILNSHAHFDHAGGIAELQQLTGAPVYLRRPSEQVLRTGKLAPEDPQYGLKEPAIPPAKTIWILSDEQWLGIGSNRLQAFATAGHTPGGTSWAWDACESDKCLKVVYADSLSPVSADGFRFGASKSYPGVLADFEQSFTRLESMPCDLLITPHPEASGLFERLAKRVDGKPESLKDPGACKAYAQAARAKLAERLASEKGH